MCFISVFLFVYMYFIQFFVCIIYFIKILIEKRKYNKIGYKLWLFEERLEGIFKSESCVVRVVKLQEIFFFCFLKFFVRCLIILNLYYYLKRSKMNSGEYIYYLFIIYRLGLWLFFSCYSFCIQYSVWNIRGGLINTCCISVFDGQEVDVIVVQLLGFLMLFKKQYFF